jgi:carbon monoxide dehydrogenase subunit G
MRFEHTLEIEASPDEVYAYLADVTKLPEWQREVHEVRQESETRFSETRTFLGRTIHSTLEIVAAEPGHEFTIRATGGPVPFTVRHLLEPAGEGRTRLTVTGEAETSGGGIFRMAGRLVRGAAEKRFRDDFARLKAILELR